MAGAFSYRCMIGFEEIFFCSSCLFTLFQIHQYLSVIIIDNFQYLWVKLILFPIPQSFINRHGPVPLLDLGVLYLAADCSMKDKVELVWHRAHVVNVLTGTHRFKCQGLSQFSEFIIVEVLLILEKIYAFNNIDQLFYLFFSSLLWVFLKVFLYVFTLKQHIIILFNFSMQIIFLQNVEVFHYFFVSLLVVSGHFCFYLIEIFILRCKLRVFAIFIIKFVGF